MREEGPNRNKTWCILKYLSAEISYEKSENFFGQRTRVSGILGQKMRYDRCPYLSFFVRILEDEIFDLTGRRDLNTEYAIFNLRCYEMLVKCSWCNYECRTGNMIWLEWETMMGYPNSLRKRDPTPLGGNVVSLGNMVVYYL